MLLFTDFRRDKFGFCRKYLYPYKMHIFIDCFSFVTVYTYKDGSVVLITLIDFFFYDRTLTSAENTLSINLTKDRGRELKYEQKNTDRSTSDEER